MLKTIQNRLIEIELQEHKTFWQPFLKFIEKGLATWHKFWIYNPQWDLIWKYKVKENYYQQLQDLANIKGY